MELTLSVAEAVALAGAMAVLAALPSTSVMAVVARTSSGGFRHGAAMACGVVMGDIVFIGIALVGLAVLVDLLGPWFMVLRVAAAAYLLFVAVHIWRSAERTLTMRNHPVRASSLAGSFVSGLLITLGDQKAVLFYLGFLPAFVSLQHISSADIFVLIAIALVAVGGTKLVYVVLSDRVARRLHGSGAVIAQRIAAIVLCITAVAVLLRG